jgi:hypothetical protein
MYECGVFALTFSDEILVLLNDLTIMRDIFVHENVILGLFWMDNLLHIFHDY